MSEDFGEEPSVKVDNTTGPDTTAIRSFEQIREALKWPHHPQDTAPALAALASLRTQLQQAEQERDALRSAWSDAGLVLGLDVDFSDDDITPAITDLRLQLQQAEARLGQLEGLLGIAARWLDEDDEQMHRALAADIRQALASSNTDPKGTFIDMHDGGEDYFIPADPKEG